MRIRKGDPTIDNRRTLEELRVLHVDLERTLRDVYVEGRSDASFVRWYLKSSGLHTTGVYAIDDRASISNYEVTAAGGEIGPRGRVIALAAATQRWAHQEPGVTCIVDADRDHVLGGPEFENLLKTDVGSLDVYGFQPRPLDQFMRLVVGVNLSAEVVIRDLTPMLQGVFVARASLHTMGIRLVANWVSCCGTTAGAVDVSELLRRSLAREGAESELPKLIAVAESVRARLPADPLQSIRGHDVAPLLIRRLGLTNDWAKPEVVERSLRGCLNIRDVNERPMFEVLRGRLGDQAQEL